MIIVVDKKFPSLFVVDQTETEFSVVDTSFDIDVFYLNLHPTVEEDYIERIYYNETDSTISVLEREEKRIILRRETKNLLVARYEKRFVYIEDDTIDKKSFDATESIVDRTYGLSKIISWEIYRIYAFLR